MSNELSKALLLGLTPEPKKEEKIELKVTIPAFQRICRNCIHNATGDVECGSCDIDASGFQWNEKEFLSNKEEASLNENDNDCDGYIHEGSSSLTCKGCVENSNWEEKSCDNCRYEEFDADREPCANCNVSSNWEYGI